MIELLLINGSEMNGRNAEKRTLAAMLLLSRSSYIFYRERGEASWDGNPYDRMHPIKQSHKEANSIKNHIKGMHLDNHCIRYKSMKR